MAEITKGTPTMRSPAHLTWCASAGSLVLVLVGCATTPPVYPDLESARAAVSTATANPDAVRSAALDLQAAQKHLADADAAAKQRNADLVHHEAYLALEKANVAVARTDEKLAEARVAHGEEERQRVQLDARRRELNVAQSQTAAATAQAASATAQAASATAEANAANAQTAAVTDALAQARAELADLNAKETARGVVVTLGDVLFDTARADLKPGAMRSIDSLTRFLNNHPERHVLVEGFTDSVGTDDFNLELSQRRADAVKRAIVTRGAVSGDRIATAGLGKEYPVAGNTDAAGRQLNRRVELTISDASGRVAAR